MEKFTLAITNDDIREIIKALSNEPIIALDTETTGLEKNALVIGVCLAADTDHGYYIITAYWDKEAQTIVKIDNREGVLELLEFLKTKQLITHNGIVDFNWLNVNYGVQLIEYLHTDTMILAHVIDENQKCGLKERAVIEFGETSKKEQQEMKASVIANGGVWEDKQGGNKEMYKADADLIAFYGAKDAILTIKLFYLYVPKLYEQGLDKFFYEDESMPLFKTATYDLNMIGLTVDMKALSQLEVDLEIEIQRLKAEILFEIAPLVKDKYPGLNKKTTFNLNSKSQLSWLLFVKLKNDWKKLTDGGRELAKTLVGKVPYNPSARRDFENILSISKDKKDRPYQLHKFIKTDKSTFLDFAPKYKWCVLLLKYNELDKLLGTYVRRIKSQTNYGVFQPRFLQHGTTSGRYSSDFQNLPRDDKRIKKCFVSRPGRSFVGADHSQLEPRVFASVAQDERLMNCFKAKEDFYSVVGIPVFKKFDCKPLKEDFGKKYPQLRNLAKAGSLASFYGTGAYRISDMIRGEDGKNLPVKFCEQFIKDFFLEYPSVKKTQEAYHEQAMSTGVVYNLYGRPRRIPEAKAIRKRLGSNIKHSELSYEDRNILNLAVNHPIQGTASSIVNRNAILFSKLIKEAQIPNVYLLLNVHDELVAECDDQDAEDVKALLKHAMETAVTLPGVELIAEPVIAKDLASLK